MERFMYYLRRLVAQGIDGIVVPLLGVVVFFHTPHSPVLHSGDQWRITLSPIFPGSTGFGVRFTPEGPGINLGKGPSKLTPPQVSVLLWRWRRGRISGEFDARWRLMLLYGLYYTLCTGYRGQTAGKYLMRLRVVGTEGQRIGYGRALVRGVLYGVSLLPLLLGVVWIFVDRQHRAWHDGLCGTRVVDRKGAPIDA